MCMAEHVRVWHLWGDASMSVYQSECECASCHVPPGLPGMSVKGDWHVERGWVSSSRVGEDLREWAHTRAPLRVRMCVRVRVASVYQWPPSPGRPGLSPSTPSTPREGNAAQAPT